MLLFQIKKKHVCILPCETSKFTRSSCPSLLAINTNTSNKILFFQFNKPSINGVYPSSLTSSKFAPRSISNEASSICPPHALNVSGLS
jgi:hypothetical protein